MVKEELLPCPFCDSTIEIKKPCVDHDCNLHKITGHKEDCFLFKTYGTEYYWELHDIVRKWSKRAHKGGDEHTRSNEKWKTV